MTYLESVLDDLKLALANDARLANLTDTQRQVITSAVERSMIQRGANPYRKRCPDSFKHGACIE